MTSSDITTRIVKAIAASDGVGPRELDTLYEYIDPTILSSLEDSRRGDWEFTFSYADHQVTLTQNQQILIDGSLYEADSSTVE